MKIHKSVHISDWVDVDIDLSPSEILAEFLTQSTHGDLWPTLEAVENFLKSTPDAIINQLLPEECRQIADTLMGLVDRFSTHRLRLVG